MHASESLSTVPDSWEMPNKGQPLLSLLMITDICNNLPVPDQAPSLQYLIDHHWSLISWCLLCVGRERPQIFKHLTRVTGKVQVDPGLGILSFVPRIRLWSSPFGNAEVQRGLPPPGLQHRRTDTLVSSDILNQDVPFLAKESLAYWPKGAGLFVSVLMKVTPGKGSVETGRLFILPPMGEICYRKVGSIKA